MLINAGSAFADAANGQPYRLTHPYNKGDENSIISYFKYDCPFCRQYHDQIARWGGTLPKSYNFKFIPVIEQDSSGKVTQKSFIGYLAYESAVSAAGASSEQVGMFSQRAYSLMQDSPEDVGNNKAWLKVVNDAGIDQSKFMLAWKMIGHSNAVAESLKQQINYGLTSTPSVVVCGKYVVTPDDANGDQAMFMQVLNAVVSKCMIEQKKH
jgi:thiol:disulfide interchange protein DsbA